MPERGKDRSRAEGEGFEPSGPGETGPAVFETRPISTRLACAPKRQILASAPATSASEMSSGRGWSRLSWAPATDDLHRHRPGGRVLLDRDPGRSGDACRPGAPPTGAWWAEYALGLAQRAAY